MIDQIDVEIGERVRTRRVALNISQASLGRHIGVTFQQVQKYERGFNRIAAASLIKIAERLDTTVAQLSGEIRPLSFEADLLVDKQSIALLKHFNRTSPERRKTLLEVAAALADTAD